MYRTSSLFMAAGLFLAIAQSAAAHFLWVVVQPQGTGHVAKVYFGEAAEPDDPALLDALTGVETWSLASGRGDPQRIEIQKKDDALTGVLPAGGLPPAVILRHSYGVVSRGGDTFLLKYYGKAYTSPLPGNWRPVADQDRLPLEVTPSATTAGEFRVTWQGKPAAGATVTVLGPGLDKAEGTADERGIYRCQLAKAGLYSVRARQVENAAGDHQGKKYASVRHYSTLTMTYNPATMSPVSHNLPDLPQATTSFGGAVVGDELFVYGGNYGDAHEYSNAGQSGDLWKLNLRSPSAWQKILSGEKLQGLAMVEHQGQLYRVGGFTALNSAGAEQDLRSQSEFARLDPQKPAWEKLPALPAGRSSHDAAIIGDTLYVIGGWNLQGTDRDTQWHDTALKIDLAAKQLAWQPIAAPPFKRRALAVAAYGGKLYCIGGMQQQGGPTTEVAIYDPAKDQWQSGPQLLGSGMDGFGSSVFACQNQLFVTTISGSIQRLSADGSRWEFVGQIQHPRFFHRLLPWQSDKLVLVGGASMSVGKIPELELLAVDRLPSR